MAIRNITVSLSNGESLQLYGGGFRSSGGVKLGCASNVLSINAPDVQEVITNVTEEQKSQVIYSINGIAPAADGTFFLHGSDCVSIESNSGRLSIFDLCPSCTSCKDVVRLMHAFEAIKIHLNFIKDISLYDMDTARQNAAYLKASRVFNLMQADGRYAECLSALDTSDKDSAVPALLPDLNLLRQYITTVHMWNYAVSVSGYDNNITHAPEDAAGIAVQTKKAVAGCGGDTTATCTVSIEQISGQGINSTSPDRLSYFVPASSCRMTVEPFNNTETTEQPAITNITDSDGNIVGRTFTNSISPDASGTCIFTCKLIPFFDCTLYRSDSDGQLTIVTFDDINPHTIPPRTDYSEETHVSVYEQITSYDIIQNPNPTSTRYAQGKMYPSVSSGVVNTWKISITWELAKTVAVGVDDSGNTVTSKRQEVFDTIEETYIFETMGVRTFYVGSMFSQMIEDIDDY